MNSHDNDFLTDSLPHLIKSAPSYWDGIRMRSVTASLYPDEDQRIAIIPALWSDKTALGLLSLCSPESEIVRFTKESSVWLNALTSYAKDLNETPARELSNSLACMLLSQEATPTKHFWSSQDASSADKGFILKVSSFVEENTFNIERFVDTLKTIVTALYRFTSRDVQYQQMGLFDSLNPQGANDDHRTAGCIWLTDLDATLTRLGMDYASEEARTFARSISALTRLVGCLRSSTLPPLPFPTESSQDFQNAAEKILKERRQFKKKEIMPIACGWSSPNSVENILNVETCGFAPAYSPLTVEGHLRPSILARLEHEAIGVELALALAISGESPITIPKFVDCVAMHEALKKYVDYMPQLPDLSAQEQITLARGVRRPVPQRTTGFTEKASISGRDLFMRAHEFEDGSLAEIELVTIKESPLAKSLMDCFSQAVSLGLQYGVPLEAFVQQFSYSQFTPSGLVDGDRDIRFATSMLDYVFRSLSESYLGKTMPDTPELPGVLNLGKAGPEENLFSGKADSSSKKKKAAGKKAS